MDIFKAIEELFELAFNGTNEFKSIDIGVVDSKLAQKIQKATGFDLIDFLISLDSYGIIHAVNRHSDYTEKNLQQVGITKIDFTKVIDVITNADKIESIGISWATGKPLLRFQKQLQNTHFVVLEIRIVKKKGKKNRLVVSTIYIKK